MLTTTIQVRDCQYCRDEGSIKSPFHGKEEEEEAELPGLGIVPASGCEGEPFTLEYVDTSAPQVEPPPVSVRIPRAHVFHHHYLATFLVGRRALLLLLDWFRTLRSLLLALLACLQTFWTLNAILALPSCSLLFPNAPKTFRTPPPNISLELRLPHLPLNPRMLSRTSALSNFQALRTLRQSPSEHLKTMRTTIPFPPSLGCTSPLC